MGTGKRSDSCLVQPDNAKPQSRKGGAVRSRAPSGEQVACNVSGDQKTRDFIERERASLRAALKVRQKDFKDGHCHEFQPHGDQGDEGDEKADARDRPPVSRQQLPRQSAAGSGATTPGSSGPFPFAHWGLWAPSLLCTDDTHAVSRVFLLLAVWSLSLRDVSPGVMSQPPFSLGRF